MSKYEPNAFTPNAPKSRPQCFADLAACNPGRGRPSDDGLVEPDPNNRRQDGDGADLFRFVPVSEAGPFSPIARFPIQQNGGPTFNIERFAQELRGRLAGNCVGWAFVINQNGQEAIADADGSAITPGDLDANNDPIGSRDFTPDTRINVASVSKTITAVAILRLLEATGVGILGRIAPFLPAGWTLGPGVEDLRFFHLLTHRTGLTSSNNNFSVTLSDSGLQTALALGATPGAPYNYLNVNFALFRVILPALWRIAGLPLANNNNAVASAFFYAVYVIEEMFANMGGAFGDAASTSPLEAQPTRYYGTASSIQGIDYPNWALWAGGGGWHLTARELAAFLAFITYDDNILSPTARTAMDALRLGWNPVGANQGAFGDYLAHGGSINWTIGGTNGNVRAAIMKFNIQVEASLVANSQIGLGNGVSARTILRQSYDAAWT